MDDPGWSWPAWKFGMKREDLFTNLHEKYNTFSSPIQDPEAFHHDVYEVSTSARSTDEFHKLLAERRQQRLAELENGLESASLEIIANPRLIGTAQWQFALQLFRTKSLDSLVRYFSSYLPEGSPWGEGDCSAKTAVASFSTEQDDDTKPFFDEYIDDKPPLTHEPLSISTDIPAHHLPPSPRSMTMCSDSSSVSPVEKREQDYILNNLTPARTLSFSETESEPLGFSASNLSSSKGHYLVETLETPGTSVSDAAEIQSISSESGEDEAIPETQFDDMDAFFVDENTETDKNEELVELEGPSASAASTPTPTSSTRSRPIARPVRPLYAQVLSEHAKLSTVIYSTAGRDGSPRGFSRKSPGLAKCRIQKLSSESIRVRRRLDS